MQTMTFCVPCLFGLEGLVGDELRRLNLSNVRVEDRRVFFDGDFAAMARANLCCRMGERVMILLAQFEAKSFEDLYQGVKHIALENFIPKDGAFPVKGYSLDSQLHSVPDCQAIVKKAAVDRLGANYGLSWLPETGATYQIRFSIMKDHCEIFLDTSGVSLHKRGYRENANLAPLHETMAAAMVNLARYRGRDFFWDPFCGSGPIVIGQAAEFDYAGAQACRVLKDAGINVVLCNSNPATIMTDPGMADHTYIEPLTVDSVEKIIERERPDALLPNLGGQTALNLAISLQDAGILDKYHVKVIGVDLNAIKRGEDRIEFKKTMDMLGVPMAKSEPSYSVEEAEKIEVEGVSA